MTTTFLDIPVYRLPEAAYYSQREKFAENGIEPMLHGLGDQAANSKHKSMIENAREHLNDVYGGIWRFNEIIGYIRLHFLGSQVRGEYFAVRRKRLARTRHKQFEWVTHKLAPEVEIETPLCDATIEAAVGRYLDDCEREVPRRYIDHSVLDVLKPYIRWYDLWATENPFRPNRPAQPESTANRPGQRRKPQP